MSTEAASTATALEVVRDPEMVQLAKRTALSAETADQLFAAYQPFFTEVNRLLEDAKRVEVTDATQVTMIRHARELRLQLRAQRVGADKLREELKMESRRRGDAIQGFFNILKFKVEPIEEKLLAAEEFAERAEQKRLAERKAKRIEALKPYPVDAQFYDLTNMPDDAFDKLLSGVKDAHEKQEAESKRKEEDRIAKEKADADAREVQRIENERLTREAAEREELRKKHAGIGKMRTELIIAESLATKQELSAFPLEHYGALDEHEYENWLARLRLAKTERERLAEEKKAAEERAAENARRLKEAEENTQREIAEMRRKQAEKDAADKKAREEGEAAAKKKRDEEAAEHQRKVDLQLAEMRKKAAEEAAARKKAEDEMEARRIADEKRIADERAKAAAAAAAPDRDKFAALASQVRSLQLPELSTDGAKALGKTFLVQRNKFASWLDTSAQKLGTVEEQQSLPTS